MGCKLIDSHCHLDDEKIYGELDEILETLATEEIGFVGIGYNLTSSKKEIEIARKANSYCTIGISPNDIDDSFEKIDQSISELEKLLVDNLDIVVAIGEIGLDYYWNKDNKELQKYCFVKQIQLANKYNLPITIHNRDAYIDTIDILRNNIVLKKGIFHCCQQNMELIKDGVDLGFYISFAGPITFKSSKHAKQIIESIPRDRILVETDSPYLSPEPLRGKTNYPNNVKLVAQKIADFLGISYDEVCEITKQNTQKIYGKDF